MGKNKKVTFDCCSRCEPCKGSGLADHHNLCSVCNGSGQVKQAKAETEE